MNCQKCNAPLASNATFCESCGAEVKQDVVAEVSPAEVVKPDNFITGLVGALIGAALGAGSIVLLSQLGFVASVSSLILAVCTMKGYELLGGRLSTRGIIVSILLILVTPYIADRIDWAIVILKEIPELTFAEAFGALPMLLEEEAIEMSSYVKNLLMIYGFAALGAFGSLKTAVKKKK